jgi:hypothetical protein
MKNLLLLLSISLTSMQAIALDDQTFYCVETQKQRVSENSTAKQTLGRFKFKKEGSFVTLTGSLFGNTSSMTAYTKLDVIQDFRSEFLASSFGRFMAYYEDKGIFLYSHLEGSIIGTTFGSNIQTVFAKCEVF